MSARLWSAAALAMAVAMGAACGDTKSGPNTPLSIEFKPQQLPSMIVGEELHDTLGNVDSLNATVFNASGDTIQDPGLRFQHADTTTIVDIDSVTGHVTAIDTGFARVVAQVSGLQSPPETLFVVATPDLFAAVSAPDDTLDFSPVRADTLLPLQTHVTSGGADVNHWRVEYSIVYPADFNNADSTHVLLTDENRKFSLVDTTSAGSAAFGGVATRDLRISAFAHPFTDTVVVEARAFLPNHVPLPGSPVRFKVHVNIH